VKLNIRINSIDYRGSFVDGPGVRTVIYLQGCDTHCDGCHNQNTWDKNLGKLYNIDDLVDELKSKVENGKITISGGEPLIQLEETIQLISKLKDMDICLYTGRSFEEVPKELLPHLNYLKVGNYKKELRTTTTSFIGSTNQRFLKLQDGKII